MADTFTANYNLTKVEVGASRDTWGSKVNANMDILDLAIKGISDVASAALPLAGGTITGPLTLNAPATFSNTATFAGGATFNGTAPAVNATGSAVFVGSSAVSAAWLQLIPNNTVAQRVEVAVRNSGANGALWADVDVLTWARGGGVSVLGALTVAGNVNVTGNVQANNAQVISESNNQDPNTTPFVSHRTNSDGWLFQARTYANQNYSGFFSDNTGTVTMGVRNAAGTAVSSIGPVGSSLNGNLGVNGAIQAAGNVSTSGRFYVQPPSGDPIIQLGRTGTGQRYIGQFSDGAVYFSNDSAFTH